MSRRLAPIGIVIVIVIVVLVLLTSRAKERPLAPVEKPVSLENLT